MDNLKKLCEEVKETARENGIGIYFGEHDGDNGSLGGFTRREVFNKGIFEGMQMVIEYLEGYPTTLRKWRNPHNES